MKYCGHIKRLCPRLVLSAGVTFTGGNLVINLPAESYNAGEQYCIVVSDAIPVTTLRGAPVYFTIGTGAVLYPFVSVNGTQLTERVIDTRTRYSVCVNTTATGGSFKLMGRECVLTPNNALPSINGTTPA